MDNNKKEKDLKKELEEIDEKNKLLNILRKRRIFKYSLAGASAFLTLLFLILCIVLRNAEDTTLFALIFLTILFAVLTACIFLYKIQTPEQEKVRVLTIRFRDIEETDDEKQITQYYKYFPHVQFHSQKNLLKGIATNNVNFVTANVKSDKDSGLLIVYPNCNTFFKEETAYSTEYFNKTYNLMLEKTANDNLFKQGSKDNLKHLTIISGILNEVKSDILIVNRQKNTFIYIKDMTLIYDSEIGDCPKETKQKLNLINLISINLNQKTIK